MDWLESILKLLGLNVNVENEKVNMGVVNKGNNNVIINNQITLSTPEVARAFMEHVQLIEEKAKEMTRVELERDPFRTVVSSLSPSTQEEFVAKTLAASAASAVPEYSGAIKFTMKPASSYEFVAGDEKKKEGK
jgi:hypothetical protein